MTATSLVCKCGWRAPSLAAMQAHVRTHSTKGYDCPKCGKVFDTRDSYSIHIREHIRANGPARPAPSKVRDKESSRPARRARRLKKQRNRSGLILSVVSGGAFESNGR